MAVFVTDGDQRSALAAVRALGRSGVPVTVGEKSERSLAGVSRYCARQVLYPSPIDHAAQFQEFLAAEMRRGTYRVLFPMTDISIRLLAEVRDRLEPHVMFPIPCTRALELAQDKRQTLLLAASVGVDRPATYMLREDERLEQVAHSVRYPVVIKPRLSRHLCAGQWFQGNVEYACGPDELITKFQQAHARIPYPLVQEKVEGEACGVFLLVWNGELKAAFCHRRLREKPPWGGPSVYRESTPLDETLTQKSFALLKAMGWQGVAMVEFKRDRRDGQAKLMEVNGRFWGSLQLAIDAGVNFPLLLYRLAIGEQVPPQFEYRVGVRSRWLLGDLDHLLIRLRHPEACNGVSGSRFSACLQFLKPYERNTYYEVFRFSDPAPGWLECKQYLREALRLSRRREARDAR